MADFENKRVKVTENEEQSFRNRTTEISDLSKKGYRLLKGNQIKEAINCFRSILEEDPCNNYALVGMGDAERKRHKYKEAVKYYTVCLEHHPGNNYALFGLADCHKALKQFTQAIKIWEEYLLNDSTNITVLTRGCRCLPEGKEFCQVRGDIPQSYGGGEGQPLCPHRDWTSLL